MKKGRHNEDVLLFPSMCSCYFSSEDEGKERIVFHFMRREKEKQKIERITD